MFFVSSVGGLVGILIGCFIVIVVIPVVICICCAGAIGCATATTTPQSTVAVSKFINVISYVTNPTI